jgi:hypothetical protein
VVRKDYKSVLLDGKGSVKAANREKYMALMIGWPKSDTTQLMDYVHKLLVQRYFPSYMSMEQFPVALFQSVKLTCDNLTSFITLTDQNALPTLSASSSKDAFFQFYARMNTTQLLFETMISDVVRKSALSTPLFDLRVAKENPVVNAWNTWKTLHEGKDAIQAVSGKLYTCVQLPATSFDQIWQVTREFCIHPNARLPPASSSASNVDMTALAEAAYNLFMCPHIQWSTIQHLATQPKQTWTTLANRGLFLTLASKDATHTTDGTPVRKKKRSEK